MSDFDPLGSKPVALEARQVQTDGRRFSPSVARNRTAIADVLSDLMPHAGSILEIASGTGEHGAYFIEQMPKLRWTYSDIDPSSLASQTSWRATTNSARLQGPHRIDTRDPSWGDDIECQSWDGLYCANMIHIAPLAAVTGLFAGASRLLAPEGQLFLYGPFARNGALVPSNAAFDKSLKQRDAEWGVRDLERFLVPLAQRVGLTLTDVVEMPANNLSVVFKKSTRKSRLRVQGLAL